MYPGYLCLVLHAHLPFVRHPEFDDFLEEDWLFEAITESYLPLIDLCRRLLEEGVAFRLTLSVSPPLAAMLEDPLLRRRYLRHLGRLVRLAELEVERTRWLPEFQALARRYLDLFTRTRDAYVHVYGMDLLGALRDLCERGVLEIITCGATHGFLPLMLHRDNLWRGQVLTALREHRRHFGRAPEGIWLPECGFEPGLDRLLAEAGLRYFFTDSHGILHAAPRPRFGVFAPVLTSAGVAVFGRDLEASRQVWCSWLGYPGDYDYREFYRDVGWDLDHDYVRPFLHADGARSNLGIKYYRITGATDRKEPYDFDRARAKAARHAEHFLESRLRQIESLRGWMDRPPMIVAPYDAELFGHWWFEGPIWLEDLLRLIARNPEIETIHPSQYLERHSRLQVANPPYSSWGLRGYAEHWCDPSNDWLYPHLHLAGERMVELANRYRDGAGDPLRERALRQAARELLLAQSSDWAFILKAGTATGYAERRSREHLGRFHRIYEGLRRGAIEEGWLAGVEERDSLFPELDYGVFADGRRSEVP